MLQVPRILGCLLFLVIPLSNVCQVASSSSAKASFLADLDSARQGDRQAKLRVARAYNEGVVVWQNFPEAVRWFQEAAKQGSMEATAWLGSFYLVGKGLPKDTVYGTSLLQRAADANDPVGLRYMGFKYEAGIGTKQDFNKAAEFYSQAITHGDTEAHVRLGRIYLLGKGVPKDSRKAYELFSTGANLGEQWSQLNLGQMYENGSVPGELPAANAAALGSNASITALDFAKARELFLASAAQGNRIAAYELGKIYESGRGVPQDDAKAFEYYKQSATRRYVPAIIAVGLAHEFGRGTDRNLLHAYVAYSLAVGYGDPSAVAAQRLESVKHKLKTEELKEAQNMLEKFKETSRAISSQPSIR